ncbi:hypothetical protein LC2W_2327 [Lacticaseibacillus paracasei]|nr:hypothetical protein LC2W_2327 [Lacticaseibacillus paracasei]AEA57840.1 Hypothetical cytosolic protein [Lacticaseibacillus paracasei]
MIHAQALLVCQLNKATKKPSSCSKQQGDGFLVFKGQNSRLLYR